MGGKTSTVNSLMNNHHWKEMLSYKRTHPNAFTLSDGFTGNSHRNFEFQAMSKMSAHIICEIIK